MADPARKIATYEDLLALGEDVHAEIVAGEVVVHASPGIDHGFAAGGVTTDLTGPFSRGKGGPGGWWIVPETDVRLPTGDTVRPDLTGWRHTTLPVLPRERPVTTLPDWVCEILSPSNADYDEGEKLALYHAAGVPWVWHVDPERRLVRVYAHDPRGYLVQATVRAGAEAAMPPFEAVVMAVGAWFAPR
jgi:Uma2 family endonuclease